MTAAIVIPARYASTRFPGKPLHPVAGMPMLERVWRIARGVRQQRALSLPPTTSAFSPLRASFGAEAIMTSPDCGNGTERVHDAVLRAAIREDIVLNLQGDALLTPPWVLEAMIDEMIADPSPDIVTPAVRLDGPALEEFLAQKKITPASGTTVVFDLKRERAVLLQDRHSPICARRAMPGFTAISAFTDIARRRSRGTWTLRQRRWNRPKGWSSSRVGERHGHPRRHRRLPGPHALVHRRARGCGRRRADRRARRRIACSGNTMRARGGDPGGITPHPSPLPQGEGTVLHAQLPILAYLLP